MQADLPVVLLAYIHSSKKKRGLQELRSLQKTLSQSLPDKSITWQREGHEGAPWAKDCLFSTHSASSVTGLHLLVESGPEEAWWLNDYAGKKALLEWESLNLDGMSSLTWVWIDSEHAADPAEKILFAGSPIVLMGGSALASDWYRHLIEGFSIGEAWKKLTGDFPIHVIPSDPFDYWDWKERFQKADPTPSLFVLSSQESALNYRPMPEGVVESPEQAREVVVEPQVPVVLSWEQIGQDRSIATARREELEYRHPTTFHEVEQVTVLTVSQGFEPEWEIPEARVIEITSRHDFRFQPRRRIIATVMSACLCLGLLLAGFWEMGWQLSEEQRDRMTYFSTFSDSARFKIILLPFHRENGCSPLDVWDEMAVRDHLALRPESEVLGLEVTFITPASCPQRNEDARRLAEIYHGDLLVWGTLNSEDTTMLQLHYVLAEGSSPVSVQHLMQIHSLSEGYLGGSNETVVNQLLALGFLIHRQPRETLSLLDQNLKVPKVVDAWRELATVLCLEDLHQPEQALSRCETALNVHENHPALTYQHQRLRAILFPPSSRDIQTAIPPARLAEGFAKQ